MTVQKCWMYGVTNKSKEETTLSGKVLEEHSRIVHECSEFMTVWKDVFEGAFNRAFTEFPDDVYSVTPRPVSISEVTSDSSRGITLVYRPETKKLNGWCAATLFDCLFMLSHLTKWVYGEDFSRIGTAGLSEALLKLSTISQSTGMPSSFSLTELMRIKPDEEKSLTLSPASLSGRPLNGNHVRQVAQRLWQRNSSVRTCYP